MIAGIVLSGGASTRMGQPKALLPTGVDGETFVGRLVRTFRAAGIDDLVVVTRPGLDVDRALAGLDPPPRVVENTRPDRGQLSSLLTGLAAVDRPGLEAVMVTIVDQPLVSASTLSALVAAYRRHRGPIVRPVRGEAHGHPVIFDRALFEELRGADPARGAKMVLRAHEREILAVEVDDAGAFIDVDSPDDYRRVFGRPPPGLDPPL